MLSGNARALLSGVIRSQQMHVNLNIICICSSPYKTVSFLIGLNILLFQATQTRPTPFNPRPHRERFFSGIDYSESYKILNLIITIWLVAIVA